MTSVRKRVETLERSQSVRGGTTSDQIVRRVLERVSDPELDLLGSAAHALAQGPRVDAGGMRNGGSICLRSSSGIGGAVRSPSGQQRQRK